MKRRTPKKWNWTRKVQEFLIARKAKRMLLVACTKGGARRYSVTALETALENAGSAQAVLDDHEHEQVGVFPTMKEAREQAEQYAAAWAWSRRRSDKCECGPIEKTTTKRSKR